MLLDGYVGPAPVTAGFVREQLLSEEQAEEIREAIKDRVNDPGFTYGLYRTWLNRSGLDFENQPETLRDLIQEGVLQTSLFDLMLGPRVKSFQLARYSEVYQFRELIGDLIKERGGQSTGLWWDGIDQTFTGHHPWVSTELRQDPNFILIAESWLRDAKELQGWMDHLEANTPMVNNPQSPNRVFSWKRALDVLEFGKVGYLKGLKPGPSVLTVCFFQVQGQAYDQRRRLKSDRMSKESIEECERLGLFRTRLPRFTQLYFYDFQDHEVKLQFGQSLTSTSSSRAGKAYLLSGTRLESKCGLSDVWYSYVESSWFFFEDPSHPFHFNPGPPPHPVISEEDAETISNIFDWRRQHGRPKPKARVVPSCIPEPESPEREPESPEPVTYVEGPSGGTEESGNGEATDDLGTPKVTPDAFSVSQRGSFKREPESPKSITYGGSRSGRMEECGDGELADHPDASNTDPVHDVKEEETESEDIEFDSWPANPSFNRELFQAMETFENAPDTYVPSSIPEEHELVILGSVNAMGHVPEEGVSTDEIPMEGVELSQPTESQMADVSDGGDDESQISDVSDGDDDESQMADVSDGDDDDKAMDSEEEYEPDGEQPGSRS